MSGTRSISPAGEDALFSRRQSTEAVKTTMQMAKQIREQISKLQKQKEKLLREIKLSETKIRTGQDEIASANMTIEKLQMRVMTSSMVFSA